MDYNSGSVEFVFACSINCGFYEKRVGKSLLLSLEQYRCHLRALSFNKIQHFKITIIYFTEII